MTAAIFAESEVLSHGPAQRGCADELAPGDRLVFGDIAVVEGHLAGQMTANQQVLPTERCAQQRPPTPVRSLGAPPDEWISQRRACWRPGVPVRAGRYGHDEGLRGRPHGYLHRLIATDVNAAGCRMILGFDVTPARMARGWLALSGLSFLPTTREERS